MNCDIPLIFTSMEALTHCDFWQSSSLTCHLRTRHKTFLNSAHSGHHRAQLPSSY